MADFYITLHLTPNEEKKSIKDKLNNDDIVVFNGFLYMFGTTGSSITFGGSDGKNKTGSGKQS